jgi:hypothetical protein
LEQIIVSSTRTPANVIVFPPQDKRRKPTATNWMFQILKSNADLVEVLGVLLESYKSVIAGQQVCDAEVINHVENILTMARDVMWNATR